MKQIICTLSLEDDDLNGKIKVDVKDEEGSNLGPNLHELELLIEYINKLKDLVYNKK